MLDAQLLRRSIAINRAALPLLKEQVVRESVRAVIQAELLMLASSPGEAPRERTRVVAAPAPGALAITVMQAAARIGGSRSLVFELLQKGRLKRGKKFGKETMVTVESINALMEEPVVALRPVKKTAAKPKKSGAQLREEILTLRQRPSERRPSKR